MPVEVLLVFCDGTMEERRIDQCNISALLGGPLTFVGAFPQWNAYAVGLREPPDTAPVNPVSTRLFEEVAGDVVFLASDDDGEETDLDVAAVREFLESPQNKDAGGEGKGNDGHRLVTPGDRGYDMASSRES